MSRFAIVSFRFWLAGKGPGPAYVDQNPQRFFDTGQARLNRGRPFPDLIGFFAQIAGYDRPKWHGHHADNQDNEQQCKHRPDKHEVLRIGREQGWDKSRYGQDLLGNPVKHVRPVAALGSLALTCFLQPIGRY
ncbi:MAG: hypothetical protein WA905_05250, partial [Pseudolabrys sp.]